MDIQNNLIGSIQPLILRADETDFHFTVTGIGTTCSDYFFNLPILTLIYFIHIKQLANI